ncbi:TonB-dependent receptor [Novosphingobium sp. SG919]|uniref:TonB-dependent receptor n=1 Tax=unclassified Novosphingobium TaxID=2644732 RepID=UPI001839160C|nr:TonB-dependent receptor [Novosphingobium sp. SG919]NMN85386.1 TonB-dependent receptor [Novosphingobium sp. SG916]
MIAIRQVFGGASTLALALACSHHAVAQTAAQTDATAPQTPQSTVTTTTTGAPPASADEDSTTQGAIVVSGLRQSLATAQAIKRNASQLVDSITSQDIGRLPDTNVAEALQRISGIQIQRNRGEGSAIAIRGLTEVRTELNGRDIFSANGGRGLSLEEIGPDLLSGVDVYKNPSAELIEGSLGGTVNLRTRMPFDSKGQVVSLTGSTTNYDFAKKQHFGASGLYSNRWETGLGEIGFLVNASWQQTAFRQDAVQMEPYYYHGPNAMSGATVLDSLVPGYETQNVQVPGGGGFNDAVGDRKRFSAAAALQWKPSSNLEIYAQFLTAHYRYHDYGLSFFAYGSDLAPTPGSTYTVDNGVATSGSLQDPNGAAVVYQGNRKTMTNDYSAGMKWELASNLHASVDYQHIHSTAQVQQVNLTMTLLTPAQSGQHYNLLFDTRGKTPSLLIDTPGYLTDPANYAFTAIQPYAEDNKADADSLRADLDWDFGESGLLRKITVGARYSNKRAINRNTTWGTWTAIDGSNCPNSVCTGADFPEFVEANALQSSLLRGQAASSVFGKVLQWRLSSAANPSQAFADVKAISGQNIAFRSFDSPDAFNGRVTEKTTSAYIRAMFGSTVLGMDWDGNAGVRYVQTKQTGVGSSVLSYRTDSSTSAVTVVEPYIGGQDYTKWLPSVNLRLKMTPTLQARFAFSKNINRPDFTQLNPSYSLTPTYNGTSTTPTTVNPSLPYDAQTNPYAGTGTVAGNPNLKPERVTSFDASLEWYFSPTGYVYATLFKKNLRDLVDNRTYSMTRDIEGVGNVEFNVTTLVNVSKGGVKGFEIGAQRFFDFLPGWLSGFGVQANYTLADSNAGVIAQGTAGSTNQVAVPLIGLSKHSFNLIALYDKFGFNFRLAYNWRSKYLLTTTGVGTQTLPEFVRPYGVLDASASYDFNEHLSLTLDASNVTNTAYRSYLGTSANLRDFKYDDRRLSARVRVRF